MRVNTYHYPKNAEEFLREKGKKYIRGVSLSYTSEGAENSPKISLLKVYKDTIIPAVEENVVQRYNNSAKREVCIVNQEDGNWLHHDKTHQKETQSLFAERDWLIFNQLSQPLITNVHDACVFQMTSKAVSTNQAIFYGNKILRGEELNDTVMKVFNEKSDLPTISSSLCWAQPNCVLYPGVWWRQQLSLHQRRDNRWSAALLYNGGRRQGVYTCTNGDGIRRNSAGTNNK